MEDLDEAEGIDRQSLVMPRNQVLVGHLVGLHSHNHPTLLEKLSYNDQKSEYENC